MDMQKGNPKKGPSSSAAVELVNARNELRKVQREIGRVNSRPQIEHLMKNRKLIVSRIDELEAILSKKSPRLDPLDMRIFQAICGSFGMYGQGVQDSIFRKFEYETGHESLKIIDKPEEFTKCIEKVFGRHSSKEIVNSILFEISNEFGIQLSKKSDLSDAIRLARASVPKLEHEDDETSRMTHKLG